MAQKVKVLLLCDMEEGDVEGKETVQFGLDNTTYEIDVCATHARQLRTKLDPFITHARKVRSAGRAERGRRRRDRNASDRERITSIRAWAKDRGIQVSDRGRIPASVVEQYEQRH